MARPDRYWRRGHWRGGTRPPRRRDSSRAARDRRGPGSRRPRRSRYHHRGPRPAREKPTYRPVRSAPIALPCGGLRRRGGSGRGAARRAGGAGRRHCRRGRARRARRRSPPPCSAAPSRPASSTMRASRGGSGSRLQRLALGGHAACTVDGAEVGQEGARLAERGSRRRIEKHELAWDRRRPIGRGRAPARTGRPPGFPAGHRVPAPPSAAPPTAGSRRPARPGRRGRAAGRPPRATPAPFRDG